MHRYTNYKSNIPVVRAHISQGSAIPPHPRPMVSPIVPSGWGIDLSPPRGKSPRRIYRDRRSKRILGASRSVLRKNPSGSDDESSSDHESGSHDSHDESGSDDEYGAAIVRVQVGICDGTRSDQQDESGGAASRRHCIA